MTIVLKYTVFQALFVALFESDAGCRRYPMVALKHTLCVDGKILKYYLVYVSLLS